MRTLHIKGLENTKTPLMVNEIWLKSFKDCPSASSEVETYKQKIKVEHSFYNAFLHVFLLKNF